MRFNSGGRRSFRSPYGYRSGKRRNASSSSPSHQFLAELLFRSFLFGSAASGLRSSHVSSQRSALPPLATSTRRSSGFPLRRAAAAMAFFYSGAFANYTPHTVEAYPVRLAARGIGHAQAANGVGKILGPLCLALIAGATYVVSPKATEAALFRPSCSWRAVAWLRASSICSPPFETHGRPLSIKGEKVADAVT